MQAGVHRIDLPGVERHMDVFRRPQGCIGLNLARASEINTPEELHVFLCQYGSIFVLVEASQCERLVRKEHGMACRRVNENLPNNVIQAVIASH